MAGDGLRRPVGRGGPVADRADAGGAQVPHPAAAGAGALQRGQHRLAVAAWQRSAAAELHRGRRSPRTGGSCSQRWHRPAAGGPGLGPGRHRASRLPGPPGWCLSRTGRRGCIPTRCTVQRASPASPGPGCLVSSAETEADDRCSPARSASSRRSWAPVHTSRCAAAIRSRHLIFTGPLLPARPARRTPPAGRRPR